MDGGGVFARRAGMHCGANPRHVVLHCVELVARSPIAMPRAIPLAARHVTSLASAARRDGDARFFLSSCPVAPAAVSWKMCVPFLAAEASHLLAWPWTSRSRWPVVANAHRVFLREYARILLLRTLQLVSRATCLPRRRGGPPT